MAMKVTNIGYSKVEAHEILYGSICQEVKAFTQKSKHKYHLLLVAKFIVYASLLITFYWLIFNIQSFSLLLLLYTGIGYLLVLLGLNFAHDCAHNTLFKSKQSNNTCFETLFLLMGVNGYLWKKRHVYSHHNYPNMEGYDVDIELSGVIRLSSAQKAKFYHRFQHFYAPLLYLTYSLYWIFYKDLSLFLKKKHANLTFHTHPAIEWIKLIGFKLVYITYIVILPVLFPTFSLPQILYAFLVMHLLKSGFLLFTFLISHHVEHTAYHTDNSISTSWFMHQVSSANDFHPFSKAANGIFGGFNCHIAHHLFPSVPHPYYPEISRIIYCYLRKSNIEVHHTSYIGGVISHIKLLKKLAKEMPLQITHV